MTDRMVIARSGLDGAGDSHGVTAQRSENEPLPLDGGGWVGVTVPQFPRDQGKHPILPQGHPHPTSPIEREGIRNTSQAVTRRGVLIAATAAMVDPGWRATAAAAAIAPYKAACVQTRVIPTIGPNGFIPEAFAANLDRFVGTIARGADEVGARLYVFSEFCLQLATRAASVGEWLDGAITIPGPETDRIGKAAQASKSFIAFNPVERIAAFPGRYFLSGVVIGPSGDVLVNYRKLYDLSNKTRPSDILQEWLARFGADSLFPVADTDIGRIGCAIGLDVNWPEMLRGLAFRGAEIVVNPTATPVAAPGYATPDPNAGPGVPDIRTMVRRVRAFENLAYILTSNLGPVGADETAPLPAMLPSEIVDYRGRVIAAARDSSEGFITGTLDIEALRRARCTPEGLNGLAQLQIPLHQPGYRDAVFSRVDQFAAKPVADQSEHKTLLTADINSLIRRGVFKAPSGS